MLDVQRPLAVPGWLPSLQSKAMPTRIEEGRPATAVQRKPRGSHCFFAGHVKDGWSASPHGDLGDMPRLTLEDRGSM